MSTAIEDFDAGVAALGILDGGRADQQQALRYFTAATDDDPQLCDAWLGRILCGDNESATIYKAWRSRSRMHSDLNRIGVEPSLLWPRFEIGMGIVGLEQPIYDQSALSAALARSLAMAQPPDYSEALATLEEAPLTAVTLWVKAAVYYRAERWPDVIATISADLRRFDKDPVLKAAAHLALGSAHAFLGEFDSAEKALRSVQADKLEDAGSAAQWFLALIARERGDEETAESLLRALAAESATPEVTAALKNPEIRLQVTSREAIAARTDPWDPKTGPSAADLAEERASIERSARLEEASTELDAQIGMGALKDQIKTFRARVRMAEQRRKLGLKTPSASNHMVFVGPPGTGKTSVARVIAKILCGLGIVKTSNVVERSAKDLIGRYLGDSEEKTREVVKSAYDGVLFIDEAYALISKANNASNTDDFGKAVVDTLLTFIENDRDRLVVIIAGYEGDIDRLLASNEGMKSRFAHRFRFATYTPDELVAITQLLAEGRDDVLDDEAVAVLRRTCQRLSGMWIDSRTGALVPKGLGAAGSDRHLRDAIDVVANGRFVRKVLENAADYRDLRNDETPPEVLDAQALTVIEGADMRGALRKVLAGESSEAGTDLTELMIEEP